MSSWIASVENTDILSRLLDLGTAGFKKRHPDIGARPGTLMITEDSPPPKIRMMSYDASKLQETDVDNLDDLVIALEPGNVTWVDVQGFGDEKVIQKLGRIFSIHPLALEDIVNMPQRPKKETYDAQVLIITRMSTERSERFSTPMTWGLSRM